MAKARLLALFPLCSALARTIESMTPTSTSSPYTARNNVDSGSSEKVLLGIRHGRSTANEWMSQPENSWGAHTFRDNPSLADAPLSAAGRRQAEELALSWQASEKAKWLSEVELVVVSPLTRCLQTYQYGVRPALESLYRWTNREQAEPLVIALPLVTERIYTVSDTGRSKAELKHEFSGLEEINWNLLPDDSKEPWWYTQFNNADDNIGKEWRPHEQGQWYAVPGEPDLAFERRMFRLEDWLLSRSERCILMVTHWGILRHWTGAEVENCSVSRIEWDRTSATELMN